MPNRPRHPFLVLALASLFTVIVLATALSPARGAGVGRVGSVGALMGAPTPVPVVETFRILTESGVVLTTESNVPLRTD